MGIACLSQGGVMAYFDQFVSFSESVGSAKSFIVRIVDVHNEVFVSPAIPISCMESVVIDIEQALVDGTSWVMWDHIGKRLITFVAGTIRRYEIVMG